MLKSLTDAFRKHDHQQNGTVTVSYEQVKDNNVFIVVYETSSVFPITDVS